MADRNIQFEDEAGSIWQLNYTESFTLNYQGGYFNASVFMLSSGPVSPGKKAKFKVLRGNTEVTSVTANVGSSGAVGTLSIPASILESYPNTTSVPLTVGVEILDSSGRYTGGITGSVTGIITSNGLTPSFDIAASQQVSAPSSWESGLYSNLTQLKLAFGSISTKAGATVRSYKITFNGQTSTSSSMVANKVGNAGNYTAKLELTDSRGFTTAKEQTYTFKSYTLPTVSPTYLERTDANGNYLDDGTYAKWAADFSYDSVGDNNSATYTLYYKETTASSFIELASGSVTSSTQSIEGVTASLFDPDKSYNVKFVIHDDVNTIPVERTLDQAFYTMDFLEGGKGIAFGAPSTKEGFECNMESWFNNPVNFNGNVSFTDAVKKAIGLIAHPVGSYYFSEVSTNPNTLFGGTWVQVTGRFLRMDNGTGTGGNDNITLTADNMPSHNHTFTGTASSHTHTVNTNKVFTNASGNSVAAGTRISLFSKQNMAGGWGNSKSPASVATYGSSGSGFQTLIGNSSTSITPSGTIGNKGGGKAFDNRPAYKNVYAWRRTA